MARFLAPLLILAAIAAACGGGAGGRGRTESTEAPPDASQAANAGDGTTAVPTTARTTRRPVPSTQPVSGAADRRVASPPVPASGDVLRLVTWNIHAAKGTDGVFDVRRVARVLRELDPDVVALQEVDRDVRRSGGIDQVEELSRLTGMDAYFTPFMDYQGGTYGMAVLTRLPVVDDDHVELPWDVEPRAAAVVTVQTASGPVTFAGVHFYKATEQRLAQARVLDEALAGITNPVIWAGDFNSQRGDAVMTWLASRYAQPPKTGSPQTFPAEFPVREIDFVIFTPRDAFDVEAYEVVDEPLASDHRPVVAVLHLEG